MEVFLIVVKLVCLFFGVMLASVNIAKTFYKDSISSSNFFLMSLGIVGFLVLQFELWKM